MRFQRRVKGGRTPTSSGLIRETRMYVEADARRFKVSKSFVVAVALAEHYGVTDQESYLEPVRRKRKR